MSPSLPSWLETRAQHLRARFRDPHHRGRVAGFLMLGAALLLPGAYLADRFHLGIDPQLVRCLPELRAVLIDRARHPTHIGELVVFEALGLAPAFADGTLLVKRLAALPGDRVEVSAAGVRVNGTEAARGLDLARQLGHAPEDFAGSYTIPPGTFLALGTDPLSLDGRYYGPLPDTLQRGTATILF